MKAKYVHTNLIAQDWRKLARFYQEVLGCVPVPPERDYLGDHLDAATDLRGARLRGMHLRLPGCGEEGPTLEIFQYDEQKTRESPAINRPGFAHLAFAVEDVAEAASEFLAAGGSRYGELTVFQTTDGRAVTMIYVQDPEGNIVELQAWT